MIVMLAGLPGSGKSTVANVLAQRLPCVVLDKDRIRSALFTAERIEYTTAQNDFCLAVMLQTARYLLVKRADDIVILDGRPFSRTYQVEMVEKLAEEIANPLKVIEFVCSDESARQRLEMAVRQGAHVAENRDYALYLSIKEHFETMRQPKLVVNTEETLESCVARCIEYIMNI